MKKYLISIDGGGTKTEFCISDIDGNIIQSYLKGPTNYKSVGLDKMYENLKSGFDDIINEQKITIKDIVYVVFGIGGLDSDSDYEKIMNQILRLNIPRDKFYLCSDGILGFYAGGVKPGIVVISGTGSIVFAIDKRGNIKRSGGWGHPFSSLGSGHFIGRQLLKSTLLYCDGNYNYSVLFDRVKKEFKVESFSELPYNISQITKPYEIAYFSRIVTDSINKDEWLTRNILNKASDYLVDDVKNVYEYFNFKNEDSIDIVFAGGVFKGDLYGEMLENKITKKIERSNICFKKLKVSPAVDGITFAKKIYDNSSL